MLRLLGLISGGWDSRLAAELLRSLGLEVEGVHLDHGFVRDERADTVRRPGDFSVETSDVREEFLRDVLVRPKYGYGAGLNPCIDCRIFMLRKAASLARERGIEVVFTGEVLGRTSMSQRRESLLRVETDSGLAGRLLRPLSARLLGETAAERDGRIDRARLGSLHGRSRRGQSDLSARLGVPPPETSGGPCCLLADRGFAARLRDLLAHRELEEVSRDEVDRLRHGRHFRISHRLKAVVARDETESRLFRDRWALLPSCQAADGRGPVVLLEGEPVEPELIAAAALAVRYGAHRHQRSGEVVVRGLPEGDRVLEADPLNAAQLEPV